MALVLNDVPKKQEIHFNERRLVFVTALFFITTLLWPLDKNFWPGGRGCSMFISEMVFLLPLANTPVDVGAD